MKTIVTLALLLGTLVIVSSAAQIKVTPKFHTAALKAEPAMVDTGYLEGTWVIACPYCRNWDVVTGYTANHDCEKCGRQSVGGGSANVLCPAGHIDYVSGITQDHTCNTCRQPCRMDHLPRGTQVIAAIGTLLGL